MIREALKEELLAEFNAIPPLEELQKMYSFSERHVKQMEAIFADLRKREQKEQYWHTVRKVAIIIIAVLAAVFASVKFVPEVYAYVKEWLMETKEDRIRFEGRSGESVKEDEENLRFELGYVPEGYELEREVHYESGAHKVTYANISGDILNLTYHYKTDTNLLALNVENALVEEIEFNNIQYYFFESVGRGNVVSWESGNNFFKLEGLFNKEQLLYVAGSLKCIEIK